MLQYRFYILFFLTLTLNHCSDVKINHPMHPTYIKTSKIHKTFICEYYPDKTELIIDDSTKFQIKDVWAQYYWIVDEKNNERVRKDAVFLMMDIDVITNYDYEINIKSASSKYSAKYSELYRLDYFDVEKEQVIVFVEYYSKNKRKQFEIMLRRK